MVLCFFNRSLLMGVSTNVKKGKSLLGTFNAPTYPEFLAGVGIISRMIRICHLTVDSLFKGGFLGAQGQQQGQILTKIHQRRVSFLAQALSINA